MEARVLTLSSGSWAGVILRGGCERNKGFETKVSVEALRAKSEQTGSSPPPVWSKNKKAQRVCLGTGLLMLAFAAGRVLRGQPRLLGALVSEFALGLQPVIHGAAIHPPFALKDLVSAGSDIIALEHLTITIAIADAIAVAVRTIGIDEAFVTWGGLAGRLAGGRIAFLRLLRGRLTSVITFS